MSKLIIHRNHQWYSGPRDFNIYLDNRKIGEVGNGDTKEFKISDGSHILFAKIDWFESERIEIELKNGKTQNVNLKSSNLSKFKIPILLIFPFLVYQTDLNLFYLAILFSPFLIFIIYFLTLGKRSLLILEK